MANPYESKRVQRAFQPEPTSGVPDPESGKPQETTVVPEGTINEIIEWVGDDTDRASIALERELEDKGRKTLIDSLEEILEG